MIADSIYNAGITLDMTAQNREIEEAYALVWQTVRAASDSALMELIASVADTPRPLD